MIVVLDANVIVSSAFGGVPEQALLKALTHEVWISKDTVEELAELTLRFRPKMKAETFLAWSVNLLLLLSMVRQAVVVRRIVLSRDQDDDKYLSLSAQVGAHVLVTGDRDLLDLSRSSLAAAGLAGLRILTPRRFVSLSA